MYESESAQYPSSARIRKPCPISLPTHEEVDSAYEPDATYVKPESARLTSTVNEKCAVENPTLLHSHFTANTRGDES